MEKNKKYNMQCIVNALVLSVRAVLCVCVCVCDCVCLADACELVQNKVDESKDLTSDSCVNADGVSGTKDVTRNNAAFTLISDCSLTEDPSAVTGNIDNEFISATWADSVQVHLNVFPSLTFFVVVKKSRLAELDEQQWYNLQVGGNIHHVAFCSLLSLLRPSSTSPCSWYLARLILRKCLYVTSILNGCA